MIFIFIDSVLLAALIFGGLATGAGVTSVVVAFILKHKTVIVVITVLGVLVSEIVTYGEITDKIKAIIYIIINTVFDLICIFRKNRALAPHERSAVPLGTDHCPVC